MLLRLQLGGAEERDLSPLVDSGEDLGHVVIVQADLNGPGLRNTLVVDEEHDGTPGPTPRCSPSLAPRPRLPAAPVTGSGTTSRPWTCTGTRTAAPKPLHETAGRVLPYLASLHERAQGVELRSAATSRPPLWRGPGCPLRGTRLRSSIAAIPTGRSTRRYLVRTGSQPCSSTAPRPPPTERGKVDIVRIQAEHERGRTHVLRQHDGVVGHQ